MSNVITTRPPLMSHEERRKLIEAPITIRSLGSSRCWGGIILKDNTGQLPRTSVSYPNNNVYED